LCTQLPWLIQKHVHPSAPGLQGSPGLSLVSRYTCDKHGGGHEIPLLFHGAGHYDLLVQGPGRQQQQAATRSKL
jgi:hypothetical protein